MNEFNYVKRWYDHDPSVSIAVSVLRNTNQHNQKLATDFLIEKAKYYNIEIQLDNFNKFLFFNKRWNDSNKKVHIAMEYLRVAPPEIQTELALDVIHYLYTLDESLVMIN